MKLSPLIWRAATSLIGLLLVSTFVSQEAHAQAARQSGGPSSLFVLFLAICSAVVVFVLYRKGVFNRALNIPSGEAAVPPAATDVEDEESIDFTIALTRKVRRARNMAGGALLFSLCLTGLLVWKISQTSEMALRFDDGVKEQLGYWGIALILSWLLTALLTFTSAYGARAAARRRADQTKAVVDRLASLEIEIARATDSDVTGELRSRKVRLESALRQLEAA